MALSALYMGPQVGLETTPGTSVAANKKLGSVGIQPGINVEISRFRAMGKKSVSVAALEKEWVQASISGKPDYNEEAYLLNSILNKVTPTGAGTDKTWTHTISNTGSDTVATYTTEYGSSDRAYKFTNGVLSAYALDFSRSGVNRTGTMLGRAITDNSGLTATPTELALQPIASTHVSAYLADTAAGLTGATALAGLISANFSINNRRAPFWPLNRANANNWQDIESVPDITMRLKLNADAEGMALLTTMRANNMKFGRIECQGGLITGAIYYKLTIDLAGRVTAVTPFEDTDGVYAIEWTLTANYDATWQKFLQVVLINTLSAL
jgi:hypothetical protein